MRLNGIDPLKFLLGILAVVLIWAMWGLNRYDVSRTKEASACSAKGGYLFDYQGRFICLDPAKELK